MLKLPNQSVNYLKRATLIGETTGGGAHPGGTEVVSDRFMIWLPSGRSINPITKTNWEGVGVIPHIEVPATDALTVAKTKALEKLSEKHADKTGDIYRWHLAVVKVKSTPVSISKTTLESYVGRYGPRTLTLKGN